MKKLLSLLVAIFIFLCVLACSEEESNPVNPSNPTLTGNWKGTSTLLGIGVVFPYLNFLRFDYAVDLKSIGKSDVDLRKAIFSLPGLDTANVSLWPFWVKKVPEKLNRINIVID